MRRIAGVILSLLLAASLVSAGTNKNKEVERLEDSARVMEEILKIPDAIPQELLNRAECVVVIPSVKKLAIGVGGSYGRGAMVCRSGIDFTGPWGAPAMYRLEGASLGLQLGGQATDFVFLVMNKRGAESLLKSRVKLGVDASAAAGPKGRTALAGTDAYLRAEILSYSRTRGLFAGISLDGSTLRPDNPANEKIYNRKVTARQIVLESRVSLPAAGLRLTRLLQTASPSNQST